MNPATKRIIRLSLNNEHTVEKCDDVSSLVILFLMICRVLFLSPGYRGAGRPIAPERVWSEASSVFPSPNHGSSP